MKSLTLLWISLLEELGEWCSVSTTKDKETFLRRVEYEGESFFTITLPAFAKDFQKSLDIGCVAHDGFKAFAKTRGLPRFLRGFLELVFDRDDAFLLDKPSTDAIFAIRQLTLVFGKIERECTKARTHAAMKKFVQIEEEVKLSDSQRPKLLYEAFASMARRLWGDVLQRVDEDIYYGRVVPRHGPGKTADRLSGNAKWRFTEWTERLESIFPMEEYLLPNPRYRDVLESVKLLPPGEERPVRVTPVPKTLKTPRIIAIEPTCMQFMQQGVARLLVRYLEQDSTSLYQNPCFGMIGFKDQGINQAMARIGSFDGSLATLDLSDASDRVSNQLVRTLVRDHPHLAEALDSTRSRRADVPGVGVFRLAKYASMGSALCFPIEAMVFLTISLLGIEEFSGMRLTRERLESLKGKVRVYGDDIIVPTEYAECVAESLNEFGLVVNTDKSYWTGRFRESCGGDFYDGEDVTPIRLRHDLPTRRADSSEMLGCVAFRNLLYWRGLWRTAEKLDRRIKAILKYYPYVLPTSPVLGRNSVLGYLTERTEPRLHVPQVKGYVGVGVIPTSRLNDVYALHKFFLQREEYTHSSESMGEYHFFAEMAQELSYLDPLVVKDHLERSGRPKSVNLRLGWNTPY